MKSIAKEILLTLALAAIYYIVFDVAPQISSQSLMAVLVLVVGLSSYALFRRLSRVSRQLTYAIKKAYPHTEPGGNLENDPVRFRFNQMCCEEEATEADALAEGDTEEVASEKRRAMAAANEAFRTARQKKSGGQ